jgi:hypothetical protein
LRGDGREGRDDRFVLRVCVREAVERGLKAIVQIVIGESVRGNLDIQEGEDLLDSGHEGVEKAGAEHVEELSHLCHLSDPGRLLNYMRLGGAKRKLVKIEIYAVERFRNAMNTIGYDDNGERSEGQMLSGLRKGERDPTTNREKCGELRFDSPRVLTVGRPIEK